MWFFLRGLNSPSLSSTSQCPIAKKVAYKSTDTIGVGLDPCSAEQTQKGEHPVPTCSYHGIIPHKNYEKDYEKELGQDCSGILSLIKLVLP